MRKEEAREIAAIVKGLNLAPGAVCLNIGSSTKNYREIAKPHIGSELIEPLEERGIRFVHCDIKPAEGVDIVGDVLDESFRQELQRINADLVLCCNLLEHLEDPRLFAATCGEIVRRGGYLVISVPYSYPRHSDPFDNLLRPSPEEISEMVPGCHMIERKIVSCGSYYADLCAVKGGMLIFCKRLFVVLFPFMSRGKWLERSHRLLWLFREYKVSIAVLERQTSNVEDRPL